MSFISVGKYPSVLTFFILKVTHVNLLFAVICVALCGFCDLHTGQINVQLDVVTSILNC